MKFKVSLLLSGQRIQRCVRGRARCVRHRVALAQHFWVTKGYILQTLPFKAAFCWNLRNQEKIAQDWTHLMSTRSSWSPHPIPLTVQSWSEVPCKGLLLEMVPPPSSFTSHLFSFTWSEFDLFQEYTTQSKLHFQCNPYQNVHLIFHRTRANNLPIDMEPQKPPNC